MEIKFQITFTTHAVSVMKLTSGSIRCCKYNSNRVDCEYFDNVEDAMDYIITPFPTLGWYLEINE